MTVRIPGAPRRSISSPPISNRHSSGSLTNARSTLMAETAFLSAFINRWHDPSFPLIVAGDFNAGTAPPLSAPSGHRQLARRDGSRMRSTTSCTRIARGAALPGDVQAMRRAELAILHAGAERGAAAGSSLRTSRTGLSSPTISDTPHCSGSARDRRERAAAERRRARSLWIEAPRDGCCHAGAGRASGKEMPVFANHSQPY